MLYTKKKPIISFVLVGVNIALYIICTFRGELLYNEGALNVYGVMEKGQYYRLVSSMFLHSGISHIFNNMMVLFFLAGMIEDEVGSFRLFVIYMLSGILGNVASLWWKLQTASMSSSVGASGAIFGLDGLLLAMALFRRSRMITVTPRRVALMIALSLYSGVVNASVDNAAHIGGLVAGFILGTIMCVIDNIRNR